MDGGIIPAMRAVVVGCGRYGSLLADRLSAMGHEVIVIDHREKSFKGLSPEFSGFTLHGDASELSILKKAEIDRADCLFSMCDEDTLNLMVAQVAKRVFGIAKVVARVYQPCYAPIFRKFGIEMVNPIEFTLEASVRTLEPEAPPDREHS